MIPVPIEKINVSNHLLKYIFMAVKVSFIVINNLGNGHLKHNQ